MFGGKYSGGILLKNLTPYGNFSNGTTSWGLAGTGTMNALSNELTFLAGSISAYVSHVIIPSTIIGNKYYGVGYVKTTSNNVAFRVGTTVTNHSGSGNYERLSVVHTAINTAHSANIIDNRGSMWNEIYIKNVMVFDVTSLINGGLTQTDLDKLCLNCPLFFLNFIL